ncbi:unnamed protein product [Choristocarpus tenellus]
MQDAYATTPGTPSSSPPSVADWCEAPTRHSGHMRSRQGGQHQGDDDSSPRDTKVVSTTLAPAVTPLDQEAQEAGRSASLPLPAPVPPPPPPPPPLPKPIEGAMLCHPNAPLSPYISSGEKPVCVCKSESESKSESKSVSVYTCV